MKKSFFAGIAILAPFVMTLWVIQLLINFLTKPFIGIVHQFIEATGIFSTGFLFLSHQTVIFILSECLILATLLVGFTLIGFLAKIFFLHEIVHILEWVILKLPFFNSIYTATKEVVKALFKTQRQDFGKPVLVPYPHNDTLAIGFVTQTEENEKETISVFVPGTPNPTMGFLLLFKKEQIQPLAISTEQALKTIISCGSLLSNESK